MDNKIQKNWGRALFLLGAFGIVMSMWTLMVSAGYVSDLYYMLAEGRRILSDGIPHTNAFAWDTGHGLVLQNWASCAVLAWLEAKLGLFGIYLFYAPFAAGVIAGMYAVLGRYVKSVFLRGLLMLAGVIVCSAGMWHDMRGGNLTAVLIFLSCWAFERYRAKKKLRYLALQPVLMLVEINFHAAMWLMHFCVLAAYSVPPVPLAAGERYGDTRAVNGREAIACGVAMFSAALCNPYGISSVTYVFDCMSAFRSVSVPEQLPVQISSLIPVLAIACLVLSAILATNRKIGSSDLYLCLGFSVLALLKRHGWMFMPMVYAVMIGNLLKDHAWISDMDRLISGRDAKKLGMAMCGVMAALMLMASFMKLELAHADVSDIASHIRSEQSAHGGNIVSCIEMSSFLEYNGATGLFWDGRIELLSRKLNECHDMGPEAIFMSTGAMSDELCGVYGDMDGYLDKNQVRFVVDYVSGSEFPYLIGWLSKSVDWRMSDEFSTDMFMVWERKN